MPYELVRLWWRGGYPVIAGLGWCLFGAWSLGLAAWTIPVLFLIIQTLLALVFFFFQAEDGIRDLTVTGVQTCALPIWIALPFTTAVSRGSPLVPFRRSRSGPRTGRGETAADRSQSSRQLRLMSRAANKIGRGAGRGRGEISGGARSLKKKKGKVTVGEA